jgi:hypothetical protein
MGFRDWEKFKSIPKNASFLDTCERKPMGIVPFQANFLFRRAREGTAKIVLAISLFIR